MAAGLNANVLFRLQSTGTRRVERDFERVRRKANTLRSTMNFLRSALVVFASTAVLSQFAQFADSLTLIQNRIRLVTDSVGELNAVQQALFSISQETRTSFEANADLFNRLTRSTTDLNFTFRENLELTRAINQALRISGATSQEARSSVVQFAQGLASGELRAEELESVTENAQRLAQVIASAAGMSAGALRSFAREASDAEIQEVLGREPIIRAIQAAYSDFDDEFRKVSRTLSEAFVQLSNRLTIFLGQVRESTALGSLLIDVIDGIRNNLALIITLIAAFGAVTAFNIVATQVLLLNSRLRIMLSLLATGATRGIAASISGIAAPITGLIGLVTGLGNALKLLVAGSLRLLPGLLMASSSAAKVGAAGMFALQRAVLAFNVGTAAGIGAARSLSLAFNTLAMGSLATLRKSLVSVAKVGLRSIVLGLRSVSIAFLTNPFVIGAAAIIAGVVAAFMVFDNVLGTISDAFKKFGEIADSVIGFVAAGVATIVKNWKILPKVFANYAVRAGNALLDGILAAVNGVTGIINNLTSYFNIPAIPKAEIEGFKVPFQDAADDIAESFKATQFEVIEAGGGFDYLKGKAVDFYNYFKNLTVLPEADMSLLDNMPTVPRQDGTREGSRGAAEAAEKLERELERERDAIMDLIRSLDPYQDAMADLAEKQNLLNRAVARGIISQTTMNTLMDRAMRDIVGVGNATVEYEAQQRLLNEALEDGAISAKEFQKAMRDARRDMLRDQTTIGAGFERFFMDLTENANDAASQVESTLSTAFRSAEDVFVEFVKTGKLSFSSLIDTITEELTRMAFRGAVAELASTMGLPGAGETNGGMIGGIVEKVLGGGQGSGSGSQGQAGAGGGILGQIATFAKGLFSSGIGSSGSASGASAGAAGAAGTAGGTGLMGSLFSQGSGLLKSGIGAAASGGAGGLMGVLAAAGVSMLGSALGGSGGGGQDGSGGSKGLLAGLAGGGFAAMIANNPDKFSDIAGKVTGSGAAGLLPMVAQKAGLFESDLFRGLAGGGIGALLPGFANGGSFEVNSQNSLGSMSGVDNRLVAFRARDGENVSITKSGESQPAPAQVTMHINTPDADSFRKSQQQIQSDMLRAAQRAQRRNS